MMSELPGHDRLLTPAEVAAMSGVDAKTSADGLAPAS